ncbi:TetR/AcrR family transcriptional regulator [Priestia abyssalis]|uniref:TetR/AcrR family transcriptional regulator n=1 Tax=Priestia abyssalis TaxID=1221450 RepID=UPI00099541FC|nr:TetR/AcrR family transcriptional regulator [Priestia abyssalis]
MTKDKIKAIALSLFAKNGYEGTSLAEIAKGVGIQKPSIYNHFKSKEELFLSIFETILWEHVRYMEQLIEEMEGLSAEKKLYHMLYATFQYYIDNEEKSAFLKRSMIFPPEPLKELISDKFLLSEEALSTILRIIFIKGIENGELCDKNIEDLVISYYCLIDGIFIELSYYGKEKMEPRIQNIWDNFWFGVKSDGVS